MIIFIDLGNYCKDVTQNRISIDSNPTKSGGVLNLS